MRLTARSSVFAFLLVSALGWALPARAQGSAAEALFEQGRVALAAGDLETACARFRASDQIDPAPGTKANLADCEEKRGNVATAWELNRTALGKLQEGDPRSPVLRQRIAQLEGRLPKLVLTLARGAPKAATVRDGETTLGSAGTYGVPLPLDPGVHHLTVMAPGRAAKTVDVTLVEGKTETVEVDPGGAAGATELKPSPREAPTSPEGESRAPSRSSGPWIVGGLGVAGLIVGGVTGAIVLHDKSVTNAHCTDGPPPTCRDQAGLDAARGVHTLGPVSTVGFVVGAAGVAAGVIWLGVRNSGKARARVGLVTTASGATWRLEGSW